MTSAAAKPVALILERLPGRSKTLLHQEESMPPGGSTAKQNYCLKPKLLSKADLDYPQATLALN